MKRAASWTSTSVERTRRSVQALHTNRMKKQSPAQALRFAASQVLLLEEDKAELQQLVRFFYAMIALEQHAAVGGLGTKHVTQIAAHARLILDAHGIDGAQSKLGHLHAELSQCLSRIAARDGHAWDAAVMQDAAVDATVRSTDEHVGRFYLDFAARALRLGDAVTALANIERAEQEGMADANREAARILRARVLRLSGRRQEVEDVCSWETLVSRAAADNDWRLLSSATRQGKPHYEPRRVLHALLYNLASDHLIDRNLAPRLETLLRRRDLKWPFHTPLLEITRALDAGDCGLVATELARASSLADVEDELLVWAAAARLFARSQQFRLAGLAARRYRALSWSLTEAKDPDVLGLLAKVMAKAWFEDADFPTAGRRPA